MNRKNSPAAPIKIPLSLSLACITQAINPLSLSFSFNLTFAAAAAAQQHCYKNKRKHNLPESIIAL